MVRPRLIPSILLNPGRKTLAFASVASLFFLFSYLIGFHYTFSSFLLPSSSLSLSSSLQCPIRPISAVAELDFLSRHNASELISLPLPQLSPIPFCLVNFTHYCPCQDPNREHLFPTRHFAHLGRHCPFLDDRPSPRCRVPRPSGYRAPIPWPESRRHVWLTNVPFKVLTVSKADQNWLRLEGDTFVFPGGGTSFPHGVESYVGHISKVVPLKAGEIRTVLDLGCGVASFGNHLLDYNVLTMSVAPRDVHEAQVQFALERGLPAMLGVLSIFRLPFPSRSFDMAHCARCLIKWDSRDGLYMLEIDRILRPGGYWVLSGPPINWRKMYKGWKRTPEDMEADQNRIEDLAKRLCWKKVAEKAPIAVWRKPTNHLHCATKLKTLKSLHFCEGMDPDAAWYAVMQACLTPLPMVEQIRDTAGGILARWPKRLNVVPPRIKSWDVKGATADAFNQDNQIWKQRISNYGIYINFSLAGKYRNIMDMNAGLGGFAAALAKYPVWVMNVVPVNASINTLGIIYERGLIGTYMHWCDSIDILLEMDRILRPEGAVIIRDHVDIIVKAKNEADRLGWQSRMVHSERGPFHHDKLLIVDNSIKSSIF